MLNKLLKSVLDQDTAPVVVCDMDDIIVYMNPSAIKRYHKDLTGRSIKDCHPPKANEQIDKVVSWFRESKDNNIITALFFLVVQAYLQKAVLKIIEVKTDCIIP